jgi:aspartate/methionine/tyrosine aminotransferase
MWARGEQVYHLGFGESRFPVHPRLKAALADAGDARSYLPSAGIPELRKAIASQQSLVLGQEVDPARVVVGPGSKSMLYATLLCLGEEILLPRPSWVTYAPQVHLLGKTLTWVPTSADHRYRIDLDVLEDVIRDARAGWGNPEVLVVNSPNNPTGLMMTPEEVEALALFAREQGLVLVSDEIYSLAAHGTVPHVSPAQFYPEGTVVVGGLSKSLSLGGWRVGHAVVPTGEAGRALARAIAGIASNVWSCVTAPVQHAAVLAYATEGELAEYRDLCTAMHAVRTRALFDQVAGAGLDCIAPDGAFYVYPSLDRFGEALAERGVSSDRALALALLEEAGLATLPGSAFHGDDPFSLRLSSSWLDAETDEKAQALVGAYRAAPDPDSFIRDHHPGIADVGARLRAFLAGLH